MRMPMLVAMPFLLLTPSPAFQAEMYKGRPVFAERVELGYFIWRDGDTWHAHWTTMGRMSAFAGSVTGVGGKLKSVRATKAQAVRTTSDSDHQVSFADSAG